jgi:hypothetical protein
VETSGLVERSGRGPEPALVTRADAPGAVAAAKMATHRTKSMMMRMGPGVRILIEFALCFPLSAQARRVL